MAVTVWLKLFLFVCFVLHLVPVAFSDAVSLTQENYEEIKGTYDFLLINLYADWCRFSQQLKPIFDQAADKVAELNIGSVALVKVDCPVEESLCRDVFRITKYPTVKIVKYGQVSRKEYRGKRAVDDLVSFAQKMTESSIQQFNTEEDLSSKVTKGSIIGYFPNDHSDEFQAFRRTASTLADECGFLVNLREGQKSVVHYRSVQGAVQVYQGDLMSQKHFHLWCYSSCVPLVREITFQNGEELTEDGIPFMILFYAPGDEESKKVYTARVKEEISHERSRINFVTADGKVFSHPLYHLGKSLQDLPLLAIDSFQHMYLFPNFDDIHTPGRLQQFVDDLYSGKLHREYHHGPDPTTQSEQPSASESHGSRQDRSAPPDSTFKKLQPAKSRYTLLRDEL